jgi:hypothetical protein
VIRDILVRIRTTDLRIRILLCSPGTFKMPTKIIFLSPVFYLLLLKGTFTRTSFFKVKESLKMSQNIRNQGFPYYFCLMMQGSGSIQIMTDPGGPKTYGSTILVPTSIPSMYLKSFLCNTLFSVLQLYGLTYEDDLPDDFIALSGVKMLVQWDMHSTL